MQSEKSKRQRSRRGAGEVFARCLLLAFSLFVMALGIAFSTKADLGVSPISCVPYVISICPGATWSMGAITFAMHVCFVIAQIALLRRNFRVAQLAQLGVGLVFGLFVDLALFLVRFIEAESYVARWGLCALSFVVIGAGVFLQVKADVVTVAGEGVMLAISRVFGVEFGKVKVAFDCSLAVTGTLISLAFMGGVYGVREGTVAAAVLVGLIVRQFYRRAGKAVDDLFPSTRSRETPKSCYAPDCPPVVTIAREYGSGGHAVGELVAKRLGFSFFDGALIRLTAAQCGFTREYVRKNERKIGNRFLYELYAQNYAYAPEELPPRDAIFLAQTKVIRDVTAKKAGVIVGRCSNFILKGRPRTFNVFLHASREARRERIVRDYGVAPENADAELDRMDAERDGHCRRYTGEQWGLAKNYDLTLDTSQLGVEGAADAIVAAALSAFRKDAAQKPPGKKAAA